MEKINIIESARKMSKELYKRSFKGKAEYWICHPLMDSSDVFPGMKVGKCKECSGKLMFDPKCKGMMRWRVKKICTICIMRNHQNDLSPITKMILGGNLN